MSTDCSGRALVLLQCFIDALIYIVNPPPYVCSPTCLCNFSAGKHKQVLEAAVSRWEHC
jgi:hypothetical protein